MSSFSFLSLPPELRHMIYKYYYTTAEGYFLQPASRKLAVANGKPIDLALTYTCRLVAQETEGLPLSLNSITVSTVYDPELRPWAGRFDYLLFAQFRKQIRLVLVLGDWFLTEEMWVCIEQTFPWFVPQLRDALHQRQRGYQLSNLSFFRHWHLSDSFTYPAEPFWRESCGMSALSEALEFTLRTIAHGAIGDFDRIVNEELVFWEYSGRDRLLNFLDQSLKPWDEPNPDVLTEMGWRYTDDHLWPKLEAWGPNEHQTKEYHAKFRFSAASAAIHWLKKVPAKKRVCIRGLTIIEDYPAVGRQESHAAGLVPFCKENPQLRISHQVSMLNVIFSRALLRRATSFASLQAYARHEIGEEAFKQASSVSFSEVADWLADIVSLPKAGMPDGSYTFTLDGEPIPLICSRIFQHVVLRKEAMRITIEQSLPSLDRATQLNMAPQLHRGHGNAFAQLIDNNSFIKANFDPGQLEDPEKMLAEFETGAQRFLQNYRRFQFDFELLRPPSVYNLPRLGALVIENYEIRPCQQPRETYWLYAPPPAAVHTEPNVWN